MDKKPQPRRRTTRGATPTDPKTFTEAEVKKAVDQALAVQLEADLTKATRAGVARLQTEFGDVQRGFNEVLDKVEESNNIKQEVLDVQRELVEKVTEHHGDVAPFEYQDWSLEEKRALRSSVVDFLSRVRTRVFLTSTWRRRGAILAAVVTVLTLVVTAASALYGALRH
jgi:hypothetical protein